MVRQRVERKLAAVLVADVAGYSRLMELDEEETHRRLSVLQRELIRAQIGHHHRDGLFELRSHWEMILPPAQRSEG